MLRDDTRAHRGDESGVGRLKTPDHRIRDLFEIMSQEIVFLAV